MVAWKNIPVFALAGFLLVLAGCDLPRVPDTDATQGTDTQGIDTQSSDAKAVDFTFRDISLGDTFKDARAKAEKLKFKFFYLKEALPEIPYFIKTRDCVIRESCDNLLIYFNVTDPAGYVSRIVYSHPIEDPLNTEDVISALEESYGPSTLKVEGKADPDKSYIQWGGNNKPDAFNGADIKKTPELIGGKYILATITKDSYGTLNLRLEITDSQELNDGKDEMDRLKKMNDRQKKEAAVKKMKFR